MFKFQNLIRNEVGRCQPANLRSHKKRKESEKTGRIVDIFAWTWRSEAVQKIATDQKDYHMLFVCHSLLNSQNISINNSEKRLVTYLLGHLRRS